ncbi:GumC family protein [Acetobacter fallax]|uniref:non-specific protein-tyrosine kinase n=1 Tax=Acetobacter fallax TaxID=1737473 RepID=A0ABX0KAN6_9PROT|nr:polysaccharide biosynthesis tyrosine autokinase [Acetobacter fallax]NHO33035.1 AAA family ATPase [Acetobacter fallax]NHO36597.1 AAA family ATPase [Acetobacter fallax]
MNAVHLPAFNGPPQPESHDPSHVSPWKVFGVVRRHWLAVMAVFLVIGLPACIGIAMMTPYYDSSASLIVGTHQAQFRDLQATQTSLDVDTVAINTEVGILKSPATAITVAERLKLVDDPYFRKLTDAVPLKARVMDWVQTKFSSPPVKKPLTPAERLQVARDILSNHVTILNDGRSYIITITARTNRPDLSQAIANTYADVFLDFKRHMKIAATWRANGLLDEQIVPLRERLRKAEQAAEEYREQNGLISAQIEHSGSPNAQGGSITVADQQLVETNAELIRAQADLDQKRARASQMRENGGAASTTEALSSPIVQQLQAQEAQLNAQAASLASTAGDANPALIAARAGAAHIHQQIGLAIGRISGSSGKDLQSAQSRVDALRNEVAKLENRVARENQANVTLKQLESEANAARAVYQDYLGRFAQTSTEATLQEPEAELISKAETPLGVSGPPRTQYMAIAVLFAALASVGTALALDRARQGMRGPAEMDSVPGLFTLGLLPTFTGGLLTLYRMPGASVYVEMVESIRTILSFGQSRFRAKTIVVTSPGPDEGKTTFALSLAGNTGRSGKRALVIDCDTRGPSAMEVLGQVRRRTPANSRLPAVKSTSVVSDQELARDVLPGVDVLTIAGWKSPSDRMVSPSVIQLILTELSPHYDMIVLDTPPILAFPDAAVLSHETDGVVIIAKWGVTTPASMKDAMRQMQTYDARVLGGVLTQAPMRGPDGVSSNPIQIYQHYGLLAS